MILRVVESYYKGFRLVYNEGRNGWNAIIDDYEIEFPHMQAAQSAIDKIVIGSMDIIKEKGGKVIRKPTKFGTSKVVEEERPY